MNLGLASGTYAFPFFRDFETSGSNQMLDPPTIETFAVPFRRFVKKFSEKALLGRKGTPELEVRFTGLFDGAFTIVSRTTIQDCSAPAVHGPIYREPMSLSRLRDHPEYLHKSQSLKPQHKRIRLATVRISSNALFACVRHGTRLENEPTAGNNARQSFLAQLDYPNPCNATFD